MLVLWKGSHLRDEARSTPRSDEELEAREVLMREQFQRQMDSWDEATPLEDALDKLKAKITSVNNWTVRLDRSIDIDSWAEGRPIEAIAALHDWLAGCREVGPPADRGSSSLRRAIDTAIGCQRPTSRSNSSPSPMSGGCSSRRSTDFAGV